MKFLLILIILAASSAMHPNSNLDSNLVKLQVATVATTIMHEWSRSTTETIVVCFINFEQEPLLDTVFQHMQHEAHRLRYHSVLSTDPFRSSIRPSDHRCSMTVIAAWAHLLRNIEVESKLKRWNRFGLFIVIHTDYFQDENMLKMAWNYGLGKAFFVQCCEHFTIKYPLIYYKTTMRIEQDSIRYWVHFDQQRNLNGHHYFVLTSLNIPYMYTIRFNENSGIDYRFLIAMTRHQNATAACNYVFGNVLYEEIFNSISNNYQVTVISIQRSVDTKKGDLIYLNEHDYQCILLTKQRIRNYFVHLMKPYQTAVWIVIVCLGALLIVIVKMFPTVFTQNYILAVFIGLTVQEHHLGPVDRSIVFSVGLIVFLLSEAYLAKMTEFMFNKKYEAELTSIEQFASQNIPLHVPEDHFMLFKRTVHTTKLNVFLLEQNFLNNDDQHIAKSLYDPSRAYLVPCSHARWTIGKPYMRNHTEYRYYVIKESIYFRQQAFSVAQHSLSWEKITKYTVRFTEGGFWKHWETLETEYLNRHETLEPSSMLTFKALISLFWIMFFGNGLALAIFLMEVAHKCVASR